MSRKKQLIAKLARFIGGAALLALAAALLGLVLEQVERARWLDRRQDHRAQIFEQSQAYLTELATTIDSVPIDPRFASEVEARYFEEFDYGPMAVWAMATDGTFLFGVPRETFSRMNAIYDREITPRLEDGVFFDRQTFFLGHLEGGQASLAPGELSTLVIEQAEEDANGHEQFEFLRQLNDSRHASEGSFVLSAPLSDDTGQALGSLYLKRSVDSGYFHPSPITALPQVAAGFLGGVSLLFLWILLPSWVYVDARERGLPRATLFAVLTALSSLIGLLVYLIVRPERMVAVECPRCETEVSDASFCPHCGQDLSTSACRNCRHPLEQGWSYCPSCRTAIAAAVEVEEPSQVPGEGLPEPG